MVEQYPSTIGYRDNSGDLAEPQAYPMGDFLGPDLVLWTNDPAAQVPATTFSHPTQPGVVTALLIRNSTFSTRIGAVPLSNDDFAARRMLDTQNPSNAQQNVYFGKYDGGQVTLTVDEPLNSVTYGALRRSVAAHPVVSLNVIANPILAAPIGSPVPVSASGPPVAAPYTEKERYPPLPLYAGFNVFGPLNSVLFRSVSGHVSVADRPIDLSGSADLELDDVHGLRNANDQEVLSAPLATSSQSATLGFRSVGSVKVNGVLETTCQQENAPWLGAAGAVAALIGSALAVVMLLQGMRISPSGSERK